MQAEVLRFAYSRFRELCKRRGTPTDDVYGCIYDADYRAMKAIRYNGTQDAPSPAQPFLTRNMVAHRLADDDPIAATDEGRRCPHGCYVVFPEGGNAERKRWLFVVAPQLKSFYVRGSDVPGTVLAADHLSFMVNDKPDSKGRRLNLHRTAYDPMSPGTTTTTSEGSVSRSPNPLALEFDIPTRVALFETSELIQHKLFRADASFVHAVLTTPLLDADSDAGASPSVATGGGRRRRADPAYRRLKRRLRGQKIASFADAWSALPLHRLVVLAVARDESVSDVVVYITDRLRHHNNRWGLSFRLPTAGVRDPEVLQATLAEQLARGFTWGSFAPSEPFSGSDDVFDD